MCSLNRNCYNDDAPKGKYKRRGCYKCISRQQRKLYKLKHTYWHLKSNAKRRGIPFELTIEQWRIFCRRTGYLKMKGIEAHSMTVDRKNPLVGYTIKNIRPLSLAENSAKIKSDRALILRAFKSTPDPDVPF